MRAYCAIQEKVSLALGYLCIRTHSRRFPRPYTSGCTTKRKCQRQAPSVLVVVVFPHGSFPASLASFILHQATRAEELFGTWEVFHGLLLGSAIAAAGALFFLYAPEAGKPSKR